MTTIDKIGILADAAKFDASCSTAGSARANTPGGTGTAAVGGICHAWSADGRCVALFKVLLSNVCSYDCAYCVNRRSNDIRRATFESGELVRLIVDFYKRNYIEGAFLSSGVLGCPDATMERLISVARTLRTRERFSGYIHMKVIPGSSEVLVLEAARWADRVSVNIELPSAASLARVAPDKTPRSIFGPMRTLARASGYEPKNLLPVNPRTWPDLPSTSESRQELAVAEPEPLYDGRRSPQSVMDARMDRTRNPGAAILPAGQTTQLVVGASPESDATILNLAENLYLAYDVRRVYYSAFISTGADSRLPALPGPPLAREHRLYQADWLFRFYGFSAAEILDPSRPFLDTLLDPKSDWALRNLHLFPLEINTAEYRDLLRIPGIGPRSASRIVRARRRNLLRAETLPSLGVVMKRARWFITCSGKMPGIGTGTDKAGRRDSGPHLRPENTSWIREPARPGHMLDKPAELRRILADPISRNDPSPQLEFLWDGGA